MLTKSFMELYKDIMTNISDKQIWGISKISNEHAKLESSKNLYMEQEDSTVANSAYILQKIAEANPNLEFAPAEHLSENIIDINIKIGDLFELRNSEIIENECTALLNKEIIKIIQERIDECEYNRMGLFTQCLIPHLKIVDRSILNARLNFEIKRLKD